MYIGGQGTTNKDGEFEVNGGFNGGGKGVVGKYGYKVGSGGGATDIRIGCKSLKCRKIIAGGAGGAGSAIYQTASNISFGGSGGGSNGSDGMGYRGLDDYRGTGATQEGPGKGGTLEHVAKDGELGKGGFYPNAKDFDSSGGGGGGGYYGGGGSGAAGGGGGSGYLDPSLTSLNGISSVLINGDTEFTDLYGKSYKGNTGNGFIHVTVFSRKFIPISLCNRYRNSFTNYLSFVNVILSI